MKIPLIPLHIITTKTRNRIIECTKTAQRKLDSTVIKRLLADNTRMALLIQDAMKIKKKTKKKQTKTVSSGPVEPE